MTSAIAPGRVTSAGAKPERLSIAGRGEASSSVGICAHELHEACILGALLRGSAHLRPSSLRVWLKRRLAGGGASRDQKAETASRQTMQGGAMASGDCVAGLQVCLRDVAIFLRRDCDDRALGVDGYAISGGHRTVRRWIIWIRSYAGQRRSAAFTESPVGTIISVRSNSVG